MRMQIVVRPVLMIILCCGVGIIGAMFSEDAVRDWYGSLEQPPYTPPGWVFGVVWPILYVLMGLAAGILWNKPTGRKAVIAAIRLFLLQLFFNGLWSPLFFGFKRIDLALIDIAILWIVLLITTIVFYVQQKICGVLMLPYLAWVSFAVYLNTAFWILNQ